MAPKEWNFKKLGTVPSRNLILTAMVGMRIRGCGLSNLSDVISRKVRDNMKESEALEWIKELKGSGDEKRVGDE